MHELSKGKIWEPREDPRMVRQSQIMEFSSPKFELLGGNRAKDWILMMWQGKMPENGIRF